MRVLLIFNNNHFTRNDIIEKLRHYWEKTLEARFIPLLETFWHLGDPSPTSASLLCHSAWFCFPLCQPAWGPRLPFALSLNTPASSPQSLAAADALLFLHPATLPLKLISFSLRIDFPWDTEYLLVCLQMILESSLILFLLMDQRTRLSP